MQHSPSSLFDRLVKLHCDKQGVTAGKMMTAPALKYDNKVYAFFWEDEMTFKLGKDYDIQAHGVNEIRFLSPFKQKPPMTAWYIVGNDQMALWQELLDRALSLAKS